MTSQIQKAIKEYHNILDLDDLELFYHYQVKHKVLYEKSIKEFDKNCTICNRENSLNSYCYCKFLFNNGIGVEVINRSELQSFINIYSGLNSKLSQYNFDNLTDEEKYILNQGPLLEQHSTDEKKDKEDEEDVFPIIIDIEPKPKKEEFEFSINEEGFKLLDKVFISNSDNEKTLSTNSEPLKTEEFQFYRDVFLPFGTYIAIMQFPILVFADRYIKKLSSREYDVFAIVMFIFCLGLLGRLLIKSDLKEHKIKFFNSLYSEKSQLIHFIVSIVLVALAVYEIALFMLFVFGIIWLISNFKDVKSKYYKSQFNRVLNSIWNKIVDILGY